MIHKTKRIVLLVLFCFIFIMVCLCRLLLVFSHRVCNDRCCDRRCDRRDRGGVDLEKLGREIRLRMMLEVLCARPFQRAVRPTLAVVRNTRCSRTKTIHFDVVFTYKE